MVLKIKEKMPQGGGAVERKIWDSTKCMEIGWALTPSMASNSNYHSYAAPAYNVADSEPVSYAPPSLVVNCSFQRRPTPTAIA